MWWPNSRTLRSDLKGIFLRAAKIRCYPFKSSIPRKSRGTGENTHPTKKCRIWRQNIAHHVPKTDFRFLTF